MAAVSEYQSTLVSSRAHHRIAPPCPHHISASIHPSTHPSISAHLSSVSLSLVPQVEHTHTTQHQRKRVLIIHFVRALSAPPITPPRSFTTGSFRSIGWLLASVKETNNYCSNNYDQHASQQS